MLSRLLIPLDGSQRAKDAVSVAQALAARFKSSIVLVRVTEQVDDRAALDAARGYLAEIAARLGALGFAVSVVAQAGDVATCIASVTEAEGADLIVLAPHDATGIGHLRSLIIPSVSDQIVERGSVPVLIVPPHAFLEPAMSFVSSPTPMAHPLVIALDGSAQAEVIVPVATALARGLNQWIILARVVYESASGAPGARSDEPRELLSMGHRKVQQLLAEERAAHRYVAAVRRSIVAQTPVKVQTRVIAGDPAERLLQLGADADAGLLALASHGQGGLARVLPGSVALALMRQSPLLLLVAPGRMVAPSHPAAGYGHDEGEKPE